MTSVPPRKAVYQTGCIHLLYLYIFLQQLKMLSWVIAESPPFFWWNGERWILLQWDGKNFVPVDWRRQNPQEDTKEGSSEKIPEKSIKKAEAPDISLLIKSKNDSKIKEKTEQEPARGKKTANDERNKNYKSPACKLPAFFERSRNQWKNKRMKAKYSLKILKNRIKKLENSRNRWKSEAERLKKELFRFQRNERNLNAESDIRKKDETKNIPRIESFDIVPARHGYSLGHISLFISFVQNAGASLRGSSRTAEIVMDFLGLPYPSPCRNTGRSWLMRLGYYKLTRPKEKAGDWVLLAGHTVRIGDEKCFCIMGIRQCCLPEAGRCLRYADPEPVAQYPVTKSNGDIVYEQLEETVKIIGGAPRAIVADYGSDLKTGIEKFCRMHEETIYIYDIKHKIASLLKKELSKEEDWQSFAKQANLTKSRVRQTALAFLEPPGQKTKARYMNAEELINWGGNMLNFLEKQKNCPYSKAEPAAIEEKIGWIKEVKESVAQWKELLTIMKITENFVKHQGLYRNCERDLNALLPFDCQYERTEAAVLELLGFVAEESSELKLKERAPGSSEILESCFGKQKQLEKSQAKSGFTGLLLGLPAIVSETTDEVIQKALESVPAKKVIEWYKNNFGKSVQAKKRELVSFLNNDKNDEDKGIKSESVLC